MHWFEVPKPTQELHLRDSDRVPNQDAQRFRDDDDNEFLHILFAAGIEIDRWYQGIREDAAIDCSRFACPEGGTHRLDDTVRFGQVPATTAGIAVKFCSKCRLSEDEIRGYLEARELAGAALSSALGIRHDLSPDERTVLRNKVELVRNVLDSADGLLADGENHAEAAILYVRLASTELAKTVSAVRRDDT